MPMMRSITLLYTMVEKRKIIPVTAIAPANAAATMASVPVSDSPAMDTAPPMASITTATARAAPLLMPKTSGPARGLRKRVCRSIPVTASPLPASTAVAACGSRDWSMMNLHEARSTSPSVKAAHTASNGIRTLPTMMFSANSIASSSGSKRSFFVKALYCIFRQFLLSVIPIVSSCNT